ncbi:hypothetical protein OIDMADRAFT_25848 [Oidiodendron maius Zn]|uniref:CBM1 domain-containing protein n=1 Tax=Oidiodendron maius (strain Zn) TaxID=913774 RepID=A0A0C3HSP8_OIDMZ|nr:hypothetical protein OIDMADRAFT_25848 [Oidiodendron maius Zn]
MNYILSILLFLGAVSAQDVLVELYGQCGGLSYYGQWQCVPGSTCTAAGTNAFPGYQCYPNVGPIVPHCFPYAQCGGQGYVGPTLCPPGWTCVASNQYFSNCVADANTTTPADPTPDLAGPGNFCGESAVERSSPTDCVPGFACSGPGVYGYYVCVTDTS